MRWFKLRETPDDVAACGQDPRHTLLPGFHNGAFPAAPRVPVLLLSIQQPSWWNTA
jgi:hypothetical protein